MTSIITGDVVKSRKSTTTAWADGLKSILADVGHAPKDWEIYRGDEFQVEIAQPDKALLIAIRIKAFLKTLKLDARMSIGIGEKDYNAPTITESNGSAFVRSGELFETLKKEKITLAINSGKADIDTDLNLMLRFGASIMNNWLPQSAEFVLMAIENPTLSQEELGVKLGINQAAVSRRQTRAQFELIMDLEEFYRNKLKKHIL